MQITIFAKKGTSKEGKNFIIYLGRLVNKNTGEEVNVRVKFREDAGQPKAERCPMNILVEKADANMVTSTYVVEDTGEERTRRTLWVSKWDEGPAYVDHSLDEYD